MVVVDLTRPTTARALVFGYGRDDELLSVMQENMPRDGIAESALRNQQPTPPAAFRILDGRILETALGFLNQDISALFLDGLTKCRAVVQAARDTLADPSQGEMAVTLVDPYQITSVHEPSVALEVDGFEVGRVTFEISFVFGMCQTSVVVRRGAVEAVETEPCSLAVTLALRGWEPPLLQRDLPLQVRFPVRPPIPVPLPAQSADRVSDGSMTVRFLPVRGPDREPRGTSS